MAYGLKVWNILFLVLRVGDKKGARRRVEEGEGKRRGGGEKEG